MFRLCCAMMWMSLASGTPSFHQGYPFFLFTFLFLHFDYMRLILDDLHRLSTCLQLMHFTMYINVLHVAMLTRFLVVNDRHLNGTKCPIPTMQNVKCPYLCVPSVTNCPPLFFPQCPSGQTWCPDGKCKSKCLVSDYAVCSCLGPNMVPCKDSPVLPFLSTTPKDFTTTLQKECRKLFQENSSLVAINTCPKLDEIDPLTYTEGRFLFFYALTGFCVAVVVLYHIYKKHSEKVR
jgi:cation-transporting ATPase 13A3/4/5